MNTNDPEFRRRFMPLQMAVQLLMESEEWLLKFAIETSSNLTDSQRKAFLGEVECTIGILKLVREQIGEVRPLPEA